MEKELLLEIFVPELQRLINNHYKICSNKNPSYSIKFSKKEMKDWWLRVYYKMGEEFTIDRIKGAINSVNSGKPPFFTN